MAFLLHGLTLVKFVICNYFHESGPNILCINRLPSPSLVSLRNYAIKTKNTSQRKTQLIALSLIWSKSRFRLHRSGQELMRLFSRALDPPLRGRRKKVLCQVVKTVPHVVMDVHASSQSLSAVTPFFKTPMPDGPYKDEIVVEVHSLNGCQYNGTVSEAWISIFEEVLGFEQDDLASLTIGYDRGHIITYKLKHKWMNEWIY